MKKKNYIFLFIDVVTGDNANRCSFSQHACDNGECQPKVWLCDGDDDCGDGSDEKPELCSKSKTQGYFVTIIFYDKRGCEERKGKTRKKGSKQVGKER